MIFQVKLALLVAALGNKITELSEYLKRKAAKRITQRHLKRNKQRNEIDKLCHKRQLAAFGLSRQWHNDLDKQSEADDKLYTLLKGEA